jgi:hypothetical protein
LQGSGVFEHVLDFYIDAVEGGTQGVRNGEGILGFQSGKAWAQEAGVEAGQKKTTFKHRGEVTPGAARLSIDKPFKAQSAQIVTHFSGTILLIWLSFCQAGKVGL